MATKPDTDFAARVAQIAAMTPDEINALPPSEAQVWLALISILPDSPVVQAAFAKLTGDADTRNARTLLFGNDSVGADVNARFLDPGYGNNSTAPTSGISSAAPRAGTLRNLFVQHHAALASPNTVRYTVQVNGVDTPITAVLAVNAIGSTSDVAHTHAVARGDRITIKVTKSGPVSGGSLKAVANVEIS